MSKCSNFDATDLPQGSLEPLNAKLFRGIPTVWRLRMKCNLCLALCRACLASLRLRCLHKEPEMLLLWVLVWLHTESERLSVLQRVNIGWWEGIWLASLILRWLHIELERLCLPVVGCQLLVVNCWLLVVGCTKSFAKGCDPTIRWWEGATRSVAPFV